MKVDWGRLAFPLLLLVLTSIYLAEATSIRSPFGVAGELQPRSIPIFWTILMYIALLVVLIGELRGGEAPEEAEDSGGRSLIRPALVVVATAIYIALFEPLGYMLATAGFVAALLGIFGFARGRVLVSAVAVAGVTLAFYALFAWVFGIRLPPLPGALI